MRPRRHIYPGTKRRDKCTAEVVYRGYGPTYRTVCTIYYSECATDKPFAWKRFPKWRHFCQGRISQIWDHLAMLKFLWLHNHHGIYAIYGPSKNGVILGSVFRQKVHLLHTHCSIYVVYIVWWLHNHREVKHYGGVPYKWDRLEQKMASMRKFFGLHTQKGSPVTHSPRLSRICRIWTSLLYYIHILHTLLYIFGGSLGAYPALFLLFWREFWRSNGHCNLAAVFT